MPLPLFNRSPRPDDSPASTSSSRFGAMQQNVRSILNGSSTYSNSPAPSNNNTPKLPFLGFLRRPQSPPTPITIPDTEQQPRESTSSRSPLRPQHTAGSYQRAIGRLEQPRLPETVYTRHAGAESVDLNRHPADVPLQHTRSLDPETEQLADEVNGRQHHRRRRRRKHRNHNRRGVWVRRKSDRAMCFGFMKSQAARGKCFGCLISGLFLLTVLTIYLTLALTKKNLGQEVHVLFIMVILGTTIFFCHSLIRLCMLALHPEMDTPRIPSMAGPEGFRPVNPIRVHVARDEELGDEEDQLEEDDEFDPNHEKPAAAKLQPPSYGLWRSSIRIDPNLLHWQKVEDVPSASSSRNGSSSNVSTQQQETTGPRPPSYASDDGVDYVVEAAPRSTVYAPSGLSDVHPAWRPGFAVSEVGDWPAAQNAQRV